MLSPQVMFQLSYIVRARSLGIDITPIISHKLVCCVSQEDIVADALTVRENLMFSTMLRLPVNTPPCVRRARVRKVIQELNLAQCADTRVRHSLAKFRNYKAIRIRGSDITINSSFFFSFFFCWVQVGRNTLGGLGLGLWKLLNILIIRYYISNKFISCELSSDKY